MNLADRLAAARRARGDEPEPSVEAEATRPAPSKVAATVHDDAVHDDAPASDTVAAEATDPETLAAPPSRPRLTAVASTPKSPGVDTRPVNTARVRYVDPFSGVKRSVHQALLESLGPSLYDAQMDERELESRVRQTLQQVLSSEEILLSTGDRQRIAGEISDDILGYGPLEPFLRDPEITEIMVNGAEQIYVEREGRLYPAKATFTDDSHLRRTIDKIVGRIGRRVDESSPMVDARLPDGSRVNAVIAPVALDGSMLTIRKFAKDPFSVQDLIGFGTMSYPVAHLLAACVSGRLNIIISGGTGSGKTTTLNVVSSFIPETERIITIEDAAELQLHQEHLVRMETRPSNIEGRGEITTRDLVRNALRMRPDRIIVGEVRGGEALDMLQAMNTGHDGSLTTLHANSPRDALARLETMVLMAGVELPARAIREQASSALDVIIHQARLRDGTRRITHITEVIGMESDTITLQDLFLFDYHAGVDEFGRYRGSLRSTGIRPTFLQHLADQGIATPPGLFDEWQR
jgi:pilus assembly protein CpaF